MAPPVRKESFSCFWLLLLVSCWFSPSVYTLQEIQPQDILPIIDNACLIVGIEPVSEKLTDVLEQLSNVYTQESGVVVGLLDVKNFTWTTGEKLRWKTPDSGDVKESEKKLAFFRKKTVERTCLTKPSWVAHPQAEAYLGLQTLNILVPFVNSICGTFRDTQGRINSAGLERLWILENHFSVESVTESNMGVIYSTTNNPLNHSYVWRTDDFLSTCDSEATDCNAYTAKDEPASKDAPSTMAKCQVVDHTVTKEEFLNLYLKKSQPVIFKKSVLHWPAFKKWTNEFFKSQHAQQKVHIKLTPGGDFEGVEKSELWEDFKTFKIPDNIRKQLQYPDLVVVRPAHEDMLMADFIDLINKTAHQSKPNISAYLEYSSIRDIVEDLEHDVVEPEFVQGLLNLQHMNIWLSDGNTLGRLHFDPYDNLLCQISGKKQVTLFEPFDNTKLYEAHIPQATLQFDRETARFRRRGLDDSTSMVMSPVDLLNPDFNRFSLFAEAFPLNCTIDEGDMLYMPAFWWHEVQSYPSHSAQESRNLAVNFWYEPFLKKEFPCAECAMDINPKYLHLLY